MKKLYPDLLNKASALLLMLFFSALFVHSPARAQFVRAQGTQIVDPNGRPVQLVGMNLGNWLIWEGYLMMGDFNYRTHTQFFNSLKGAFGGSLQQTMEFEHQWRLNYVNPQSIAELKSMGFNSVRVPFHYNLFWDGTGLTDRGFQYFDRVIDYCRANGMYVLLDMHAAPGYQNPGDHSDNVNSNASQSRESVQFWDGNNVNIAAQVWRHIANRYKNEPVVWGYDLINEPVPQDGREYELLPSLITMRNAIREVDNHHIIVAEGSWWASDMQKLDWMDPNVQSRSGVNYRWDNNLVYQTHHYTFGNAASIQDMNGRKAITDKLNIPLILGEYGEDENHIIRELTDWCITNNVGYFPWSFKKMYHERTLWTINPNAAYNRVRDFIRDGGTPPANAYNDMISFAQNNIGNGSPGITYHSGFYDAVKPNTPPPSTTYTIPGTLQAEGFSAQSGVQTENTTDTGGGQNVGWLDAGDWMSYRVNVSASGTYTVRYRVASANGGGSLRLEAAGGGTVYGSISVPATGGWQSWTTISHNVQLTAGEQDIAIAITAGGFNLNWIEFASVATNQPPYGQTIWLRGTNSQYVSSENGTQAMMCNRASVGGWEQFTVINPNAGEGKVALRGSNGLYVSSENGATGMMCNRSAIGGWEVFDWAAVAGSQGQISLRGSNGRYVSSMDGQSGMMCSSASVSGWEAFSWGAVGSGARMSATAENKEGPAAITDLQVYPNPASGAFTIRLSEPASVKVVDVNGRSFFSAEVAESVTVDKLKAGIYMVVMQQDQRVTTKRIIVQ